MATFEFAVIADGLDPASAVFEDRFFAAGCDDATIAFQRGAIVLEFARDADTFAEAVESAVANVETAGARVKHVEPDSLVSVSDIAERCGLTKAAISLYATGQRGEGFPAPISRVTTESPLWDWVEVARWLVAQGKATLPAGAVDDALTIRQWNARLAARREKPPRRAA